MKNYKLSEREKQVISFIKDFEEKRGYSPSIREITRSCGYKSCGSVHKQIMKLAEYGIIIRKVDEKGKMRALEVNELIYKL